MCDYLISTVPPPKLGRNDSPAAFKFKGDPRHTSIYILILYRGHYPSARGYLPHLSP